MKKLLPILFVLIITSCSKEIQLDQLVERHGTYYEINSQTPFSGGVYGYHQNNTLSFEGNFLKGKKNGLHKKYFDNGQLSFEGNFTEGREVGLHLDFYDNGQIMNRKHFNSETNELSFERYWKNGQPWRKKYFKNGKEQGFQENYSSNGELKDRTHFIDGVRNGLYEEYHSNGLLRVQYIIQCERGVGTMKSYNQDGELINSIKFDKEPSDKPDCD